MKELENLKPYTQHEIKADVKQEYKLVGKIRMRKGMKLFAHNFVDNTVEEVKIEKRVAVNEEGKPQTENRAQHRQNFVYIQALNYANARRKADKLQKKIKK